MLSKTETNATLRFFKFSDGLGHTSDGRWQRVCKSETGFLSGRSIAITRGVMPVEVSRFRLRCLAIECLFRATYGPCVWL
jgi:hypothetical protein